MPRLLNLKQKWGLSVAALIRRAFDLDVISERQYREFNIRLNRLNWRKVEPGLLPPEPPSTIKQVVAMRQRAGDTIEQLAAAAKMSVRSFACYFTDQPVRRLAFNLEAP
jgi:Zn-dependent peptidase ImmA (M78 family)